MTEQRLGRTPRPCTTAPHLGLLPMHVTSPAGRRYTKRPARCGSSDMLTRWGVTCSKSSAVSAALNVRRPCALNASLRRLAKLSRACSWGSGCCRNSSAAPAAAAAFAGGNRARRWACSCRTDSAKRRTAAVPSTDDGSNVAKKQKPQLPNNASLRARGKFEVSNNTSSSLAPPPAPGAWPPRTRPFTASCKVINGLFANPVLEYDGACWAAAKSSSVRVGIPRGAPWLVLSVSWYIMWLRDEDPSAQPGAAARRLAAKSSNSGRSSSPRSGACSAPTT
mmetsp:Transcript_105039/g.321917  ORF Transcript_105039/g.321917 Transcript_105039/m.321917 type:complete len:279 (-) Transcript_105039:390-1226(-)